MNYCTLQDLIEEFGENELIQLTDETNTNGINPDAVLAAIENIDALINGMLSGRYVLPIDPVDPMLTLIAKDLVRYRLYKDQATETVIQRKKDALDLLRSIAEGKIKISSAASAENKSAGMPEYSAPGRAFDLNSLKDY